MSILRLHKCGDLQMICPRCMSTGCDNSRCDNSIGHNSKMVCKNCGGTDVMSMERYQYRLKSQHEGTVKVDTGIERRLQALENVNHLEYTNSGVVRNTGSISFIGIIKFIAIGAICYGISTVYQSTEFTGIMSLIISIINIIGGIFALIIGILSHLVT